jgi:hypothetical protein
MFILTIFPWGFEILQKKKIKKNCETLISADNQKSSSLLIIFNFILYNTTIDFKKNGKKRKTS